MMHEQQRQRVFEVAKSALIVLSAYDEMQLSGDMAAPFFVRIVVLVVDRYRRSWMEVDFRW